MEITGITPAHPGVSRTWRESWVPLRNADGIVTEVTVSVEESTEERAAERRQAYLFRLEERLRAVTDAGEAIQVACEALGRELWSALAGSRTMASISLSIGNGVRGAWGRRPGGIG